MFISTNMNNYFDHEKLHVYRAAIEFVVLADEMIKQLPRGKAYLVDQLQRAGSSIPLNIAEGAGEFSHNEKFRFYRMAKRSANMSRPSRAQYFIYLNFQGYASLSLGS